jgi:hypothetical protein
MLRRRWPEGGGGGQLAEAPPADPGPAEAGAAGRVMAGRRIIEGVFASRYAGAMLLHAFGSQAGRRRGARRRRAGCGYRPAAVR